MREAWGTSGAVLHSDRTARLDRRQRRERRRRRRRAGRQRAPRRHLPLASPRARILFRAALRGRNVRHWSKALPAPPSGRPRPGARLPRLRPAPARAPSSRRRTHPLEHAYHSRRRSVGKRRPGWENWAVLRGTTLVLAAASAAALLLAGCGSNDTELRSEGSHQRARPAGLGIERLHVVARPVSPTKSRRCVTAAFEPSGTQAYAAVVRRRVAVVHAWPSAGSPVRRQFARIDQNGFPTVFGVLGSHLRDCRPVWFKAQLPSRPNGSEGWVRAADVSVYPVTNSVVVDLSSRRLFVYARGRLALQTRVAIGTAETPTPVGRFYVNERFRLDSPDGPFGVAGSASRRTRTCCRTGSRAARSRSTERTTRLRSAARPPTAVSGSRTPTCAACSGWRRRASRADPALDASPQACGTGTGPGAGCPRALRGLQDELEAHAEPLADVRRRMEGRAQIRACPLLVADDDLAALERLALDGVRRSR